MVFVAYKQGNAQIFFQRFDLQGHGSLGNETLLGRLRKIQILRHAHKIFQLLQIHLCSHLRVSAHP